MNRGREGRQLPGYWSSLSLSLITLGPAIVGLKMEEQVSALLGLTDPDGCAHGWASVSARAQGNDHSRIPSPGTLPCYSLTLGHRERKFCAI